MQRPQIRFIMLSSSEAHCLAADTIPNAEYT